jgi:hypothetical protein
MIETPILTPAEMESAVEQEKLTQIQRAAKLLAIELQDKVKRQRVAGGRYPVQYDQIANDSSPTLRDAAAAYLNAAGWRAGWEYIPIGVAYVRWEIEPLEIK